MNVGRVRFDFIWSSRPELLRSRRSSMDFGSDESRVSRIDDTVDGQHSTKHPGNINVQKLLGSQILMSWGHYSVRETNHRMWLWFRCLCACVRSRPSLQNAIVQRISREGVAGIRLFISSLRRCYHHRKAGDRGRARSWVTAPSAVAYLTHPSAPQLHPLLLCSAAAAAAAVASCLIGRIFGPAAEIFYRFSFWRD